VKDEEEVKEVEKEGTKEYSDRYVPYGPTSFSELDSVLEAREQAAAIEDLNYEFRRLIDNIINSGEIDDKMVAIETLVEEYKDRLGNEMTQKASRVSSFMRFLKGESQASDFEIDWSKAVYKRENGIDYPASDFAYVPDPTRAESWKLRMTDGPGKVSLRRLKKIAAALSSGNSVQLGIPDSALSSVKRIVRRQFRRIGVVDASIPSSVKSDQSPLYIWKDNSGVYHFCAVYSNKFIDDDNPPDILSEKAHKAFHGAVERGIFDYPELQHWHIPGSRWGKATKLMYVDGFAIALGDIDKGHEAEAEAMMDVDYPIAVSHGMPMPLIVRNKSDKRVIDFYVSKEISDLPLDAAANKYTGFVIFEQRKERSMSLTAEQQSYLRDLDLPETMIEGLNGLNETAKELEEAGRESKEVNEADAENEQDEAENENKAITVEQFGMALGEVIQPIVEAIKQSNARMSALESVIKELQVGQNAGIDKAVEMTPVSSIRELVKSALIGDQDAQEDGRSSLAKSKPREAANNDGLDTGSDFLNSLVATSYGGDR